ncbi:recombinase family protein, partial [Klebsiella pneumoniae]|uniref:recombinase family protein n=1 Tax=Klebsiella pneumoniae TaxID=573 RepID=UPI002FF39B58
MALLGYARVSTSHQKLTLQVAELKSAGVREDRIFTDMMTGATDEREGLQRLLGRAEKDDIIICTKMGTVAKLAMRQPFVLFKGLTFQKLCLPGAFRPGDHHN